MQTRRQTKLSPGAMALVLLVPWVFVAVYALIYRQVVWPRAVSAGGLALVLGIFVALVFVSFVFAAVTFSRDVLRGEYP